VAWRLAYSLVVLRNEVNALAPDRSKVSDGAIGDTAHAARCSRHNVNDEGVVTALDLTHDPDGGCDIHAIADQIRRRPHPQLAHIISAGRIAGRSTGWRWHTYTGANQHHRHAHFGVGSGTDCDPGEPYDSTASWGLAAPAPQEDDMPITDAEFDKIRRIVRQEVAAGQLVDSDSYLAKPTGSEDDGPVYSVANDHTRKVLLPRGEGGLHEWVKALRRLGGLSDRAVEVDQDILDQIPTVTVELDPV
jgi:hypothetical protein